jgi:hypothetical protein
MARCAFHTQPNCDTTCFGNEGWICESHPDQGWPHDDCAGPGEPCPRCDTDDPPRLPDDWQSFVRVK